jgi:hypothetical protein
VISAQGGDAGSGGPGGNGGNTNSGPAGSGGNGGNYGNGGKITLKAATISEGAGSNSTTIQANPQIAVPNAGPKGMGSGNAKAGKSGTAGKDGVVLPTQISGFNIIVTP